MTVGGPESRVEDKTHTHTVQHADIPPHRHMAHAYRVGVQCFIFTPYTFYITPMRKG